MPWPSRFTTWREASASGPTRSSSKMNFPLAAWLHGIVHPPGEPRERAVLVSAGRPLLCGQGGGRGRDRDCSTGAAGMPGAREDVNPTQEELPVTLTRRRILLLLSALAQASASMFAASAPRAAADEGVRASSPAADPKGRATTHRYVIVNADDFGESPGVNRGIIEAHERGIVTSASLMVDQPATNAAVALARQHPDLSLGLHVNLDRVGAGLIGQEYLDVVGREIERQVNVFTTLTGTLPTHIDSHHHAHRQLNVARLFLTLSQRYRIPLRGFSDAVYLGSFYARWD